MSVQFVRMLLTLCQSVTVLWSPNPDQDPRKTWPGSGFLFLDPDSATSLDTDPDSVILIRMWEIRIRNSADNGTEVSRISTGFEKNSKLVKAIISDRRDSQLYISGKSELMNRPGRIKS